MTQNINEYLWGDLKVGLSSSFPVKVTEEMMENFLTFCRDRNPIHIDKSYAEYQTYSISLMFLFLVS
mgnify:CR=1 FL=1